MNLKNFQVIYLLLFSHRNSANDTEVKKFFEEDIKTLNVTVSYMKDDMPKNALLGMEYALCPPSLSILMYLAKCIHE